MNAQPWSTWTDLPCGCSTSDRGAWIVARRCEDGHRDLIPPILEQRWYALGESDYGPFRPDAPVTPMVRLPETGSALSDMIGDEN